MYFRNRGFRLPVALFCSALSLSLMPGGGRASHAQEPVAPAGVSQAGAISSEAELAGVIALLPQPSTRLQALSSLLNFAKFELYRHPSLSPVYSDPQTKALLEKAVEAIRGCADLETVGQALDSPDPELQRWGISYWSSGVRRSRADGSAGWMSLVPRVKRLASEGDEDVRFWAVERLGWHIQDKSFYEERVANETSAAVLHRLLYGDGPGPTSRRLNPRLLRLLNYHDEEVRHGALMYIGFNKLRAEMWQVSFSREVAGRVKELARSPIEREREAARYASQAVEVVK